eukprot:Nk52_evm25s160 gene=Nk52_evmTU25s160
MPGTSMVECGEGRVVSREIFRVVGESLCVRAVYGGDCPDTDKDKDKGVGVFVEKKEGFEKGDVLFTDSPLLTLLDSASLPPAQAPPSPEVCSHCLCRSSSLFPCPQQCGVAMFCSRHCMSVSSRGSVPRAKKISSLAPASASGKDKGEQWVMREEFVPLCESTNHTEVECLALMILRNPSEAKEVLNPSDWPLVDQVCRADAVMRGHIHAIVHVVGRELEEEEQQEMMVGRRAKGKKGTHINTNVFKELFSSLSYPVARQNKQQVMEILSASKLAFDLLNVIPKFTNRLMDELEQLVNDPKAKADSVTAAKQVRGKYMKHFSAILQRIQSNAFTATITSGSVSGSRLFGNGDEHQQGGVAIYPAIAMLNHDCTPNATVVDDYITVQTNSVAPAKHRVRRVQALRKINHGEEVCISYVQGVVSVQERQSRLMESFGFRCACSRCQRELCDLEVEGTTCKEMAEKKQNVLKKVTIAAKAHPSRSLETRGLKDGSFMSCTLRDLRVLNYIGHALRSGEIGLGDAGWSGALTSTSGDDMENNGIPHVGSGSCWARILRMCVRERLHRESLIVSLCGAMAETKWATSQGLLEDGGVLVYLMEAARAAFAMTMMASPNVDNCKGSPIVDDMAGMFGRRRSTYGIAHQKDKRRRCGDFELEPWWTMPLDTEMHAKQSITVVRNPQWYEAMVSYIRENVSKHLQGSACIEQNARAELVEDGDAFMGEMFPEMPQPAASAEQEGAMCVEDEARMRMFYAQLCTTLVEIVLEYLTVMYQDSMKIYQNLSESGQWQPLPPAMLYEIAEMHHIQKWAGLVRGAGENGCDEVAERYQAGQRERREQVVDMQLHNGGVYARLVNIVINTTASVLVAEGQHQKYQSAMQTTREWRRKVPAAVDLLGGLSETLLAVLIPLSSRGEEEWTGLAIL